MKSNLTKKLALTDPYRIKSPAEVISVNYQLPLGIQLLKVYINEDEYEELLEDADRCRNITQVFKNRSYSKKTPATKETVISAMKRDQSLIFTTVPEEDNEIQSPVKIEHVVVQPKPLSRPKFLNLRNKTTDLSSEPKPKAAPVTPLRGQTSVCSTPIAELNKVLHQRALSICVDPQEEKSDVSKADSLNSVLSAISENSDHSVANKETIVRSAPYVKVALNAQLKAHKSLWDLKRAETDELAVTRKRSSSVSDATFPLTCTNGAQISRFLYNVYVKEQVSSLHAGVGVGVDVEVESENRASETNTEEWKSVENLDSDLLPVGASSRVKFSAEKASQQSQKRALTLPLKSFTSDADSSLNSPSGFRNPCKNFGGVQLTPLMSKLSLLAATEERSSGFCSVVTTPSEYKDYVKGAFSSKNASAKGFDDGKFAIDCKLRKAGLFVCGQQDMVVILVMEEDGCFDKAVVNKLVGGGLGFIYAEESGSFRSLVIYMLNELLFKFDEIHFGFLE